MLHQKLVYLPPLDPASLMVILGKRRARPVLTQAWTVRLPVSKKE